MDADLLWHVVPVEVVPKVGKPDGILRRKGVKVVPKMGKLDRILRIDRVKLVPKVRKPNGILVKNKLASSKLR